MNIAQRDGGELLINHEISNKLATKSRELAEREAEIKELRELIVSTRPSVKFHLNQIEQILLRKDIANKNLFELEANNCSDILESIDELIPKPESYSYLDAEIAKAVEPFKADAEIGKLVREKLVSGNSIPISQCIVRAGEVEAIDAAIRARKG